MEDYRDILQDEELIHTLPERPDVLPVLPELVEPGVAEMERLEAEPPAAERHESHKALPWIIGGLAAAGAGVVVERLFKPRRRQHRARFAH